MSFYESKIVPEWFQKTSVYQINPRTFSAEGTLNAVTEQLPLLAKLGFGVMYLCPIFRADDSEQVEYWSPRQCASQTGNPKNPYKMVDYFEIDSEYGTMEDLRTFVRESHKLGMRVILDLVYMHMGLSTELFCDHPEFASRNEDGSIRFTKYHFPYLNYDCEGLKEYLWCNMSYYVGAIGVDGFRCDVADSIPLDFWREGQRRIRLIKPDAIMINEGLNVSYLEVFDANYGFKWQRGVYSLLIHEIRAHQLCEIHQTMADELCEDGLLLRYFDNHDTVTDWPYRIEEHFGNDCMEMILTMTYMIDGVPMVYCGNELADKARISMFANRFHMGAFEATNRNVGGEEVERRKQIIKQLNGLKATDEILRHGNTQWIDLRSDWVVAFSRVWGNQSLTFIGHFSDETVEIDWNGHGKAFLSHNAVIHDRKLTLLPYGYIVLKGDIT